MFLNPLEFSFLIYQLEMTTPTYKVELRIKEVLTGTKPSTAWALWEGLNAERECS